MLSFVLGREEKGRESNITCFLSAILDPRLHIRQIGVGCAKYHTLLSFNVCVPIGIVF